MSGTGASAKSSSAVIHVGKSATNALDIFESFPSINNQHAMVRRAKDRVESELAVSFCKGIDKSLNVAESSRDFSKDTAALLQTVLKGNTGEFSKVMAEKRQEIDEGHQAIIQVRGHFQDVRRKEALIQQDILTMTSELDEEGSHLTNKADALDSNITILDGIAKISSEIVTADLSSRLARGVLGGNGIHNLPWWGVACVAVVAYLSTAESAENKTKSKEAREEALKCFKAIDQLAKLGDDLKILDSYVDIMIAWWRKQEEVFTDLEKLINGKKSVQRYRIETVMEDFLKAEGEFADYKAQLESVQRHPHYERYLLQYAEAIL